MCGVWAGQIELSESHLKKRRRYEIEKDMEGEGADMHSIEIYCMHARNSQRIKKNIQIKTSMEMLWKTLTF